ncbi:hypothetical protein ABNG02_12450 [Halorubrum ejinorense]|uniref:DUF7123 domain-containing protein n=1 Tax=Halorubrum ejinorense TaxID=425309 RepID=A0AAV3SQ74_9EURY
MSTVPPDAAAELDAVAVESHDLSAKQARILGYLRENATDRTYFKSRLIADDLDLSAKEVGANMGAVADAATDVDVEKWGYSSGTTWMVTT